MKKENGISLFDHTHSPPFTCLLIPLYRFWQEERLMLALPCNNQQAQKLKGLIPH